MKHVLTKVPVIYFTLLLADVTQRSGRITDSLFDLATCFTKSQMHCFKQMIVFTPQKTH